MNPDDEAPKRPDFDELDEKVEGIAKSTRFDDPPDVPTLDARFKKAKADLNRTNESINRGKENPKSPSGSQGEDARSLGVAMAVAYNLIGVTVGGWFIGFLLGLAFGNSKIFQAFGALIGAMLGLVASILVITRVGSDPK